MKLGRLMLGGLAALALQGCATPQIMSANDRGGIIKFAGNYPFETDPDGAANRLDLAAIRYLGEALKP